MQRMIFNAFSHRPNSCIFLLSVLINVLPLSHVFFAHDSTILLLYADLFVGRVACIPLYHPSVARQPTLIWSRFRTAVERGPFHSIGTRAAPPSTAQSRAVGGRTLPFIAKPRLRAFLIRSRTDSA